MTQLATSTWPDIGRVDVALIPLGSTEQHGPHLPFETDTRIAQAVAGALANVLAGDGISAVVTPPVSIGSSGEHQDFPGTLSIGQNALRLVVIELARSAKNWAPRVIFVNGHGGNAPVLTDAVEQLRAEEHACIWVSCGIPGQDAHAGREETSIMLHLSPEAVHLDRAEPGNLEPLAELLPRMREVGVRGVSAQGVLGDPTGAHAAEGEQLLQTMTERVLPQIQSFLSEAL